MEFLISKSAFVLIILKAGDPESPQTQLYSVLAKNQELLIYIQFLLLTIFDLTINLAFI